MSAKRRIAILGATGSIGTNALRVIRKHADKLELVGIAGKSNRGGLSQIADEFGVKDVAVFETGTLSSCDLKESFPPNTRVHTGLEGLVHIACLDSVDILLVAVVGTAALIPCIEAIRLGRTIALASKEILVMAGAQVMPLVKQHGARLLPTDSEHNAIFQCLRGEPSSSIAKIILTASGGPYLHTPIHELDAITPDEAVKHPRWSMGPKISIDSATMANKGLEMIEAKWLFGLESPQIEVIIHPQSIVHSMVQFVDGSHFAQLSPPNMSFSIQNCLLYPDRLPGVDAPLDFSRMFSLDFLPPDPLRFPCLRLAREALAIGGNAPTVYNAANETAVSAFCQHRIRFTRIPAIIEQTLHQMNLSETPSIEAVIQCDAEARRISTEQIIS